jgi:DNA-cytosine methyltransferase
LKGEGGEAARPTGAKGAPAPQAEPAGGFRFADLFAGIGGIRRGFEAAGGRCVFTSEWNPHAQKTYRANFDDEHAIAGDITKVRARDIPDHDVLVGGFPCFAKGTLVHAMEGLRPIEEIRAGDWVLGCSGEYRRVSAAMAKDAAPTRAVRALGCPELTTTDEHPFWARRATRRWNPARSRHELDWSEPRWTPAKELDQDCYVGLPLDQTMLDARRAAGPGRAGARFWRQAGVRLALEAGLELQALGAVGASLPGYAHHLPLAWREALWEGWSQTVEQKRAQKKGGGTKASRALALDMARLARAVSGRGFGVQRAKSGQGFPGWSVNSTRAWVDQGCAWARVSSNRPTGRAQTVHNIAVEGDESYVVEGVLAHNCQPFSIAGVSKKASMGRAHGFEDKTQGTLFFDVARIIKAKRPKAFLLENVKNLLSHDKGRTFQVIKETLEEELGYVVQWKVVDSSAWVPQKRERLLIVGFRRDAGFDFADLALPAQGPKLASILHPQDGSEAPTPFTEGALGSALSKYTVTPGLWAYLQAYAAKHKAAGNGFGFGLVDGKSVTRTLSARYYKDGSEILVSQGLGKTPRRLTPRECARLMGFPESQKIPVSDTQAYKQFGNSVVVPAIEAVAQLMAPCVAKLIQEEALGAAWPKRRKRSSQGAEESKPEAAQAGKQAPAGKKPALKGAKVQKAPRGSKALPDEPGA